MKKFTFLLSSFIYALWVFAGCDFVDSTNMDQGDSSGAPALSYETFQKQFGCGGGDDAAIDTGDSDSVGNGTELASYGAKCDGVSDDRDAIQSAFDDVADWTDKTLIFPSDGTCIISGPISLSGDGWTIEGQNATIKAQDGLSVNCCGPMLLFADVRNFSISQLHVDGNRATRRPAETWSGHNVVFKNAKNGLIEKVKWKNAATDNAYISAGNPSVKDTFSSELVFTDSIFANAYRNNVSVIEGWEISFNGTCSGGVSGSCTCQFTGANGTSPEAGIDWEPNPGSATPGVDNGWMDGCLFADNYGSGVMISDIGQAKNVTLRNSIVRSNGHSTTTTMKDAITILGSGVIVENNWIGRPAGMRFAVIYVGGGGRSSLRNTQIRNNLIQGRPPVATDTGRRQVVLFGNFGDNTASFLDNTMLDIGVSADGDWCEDWKNHRGNIFGNLVDGKIQSSNSGCP